jgi:hypothetical protein
MDPAVALASNLAADLAAYLFFRRILRLMSKKLEPLRAALLDITRLSECASAKN